jgi:DNA-binding NarL/FixJ family response regulator
VEKRILIVDDNRPLVRMMTSALETLSYALDIASVPSGEEALLSVALDQPDLMVIDLHLPGMSGIDLIQEVQDRYPAVKIVMMTGDDDPFVFRIAQEMGVYYRFPKPFDTDLFLDAVNRLLTGQELGELPPGLPGEPPERMEPEKPKITYAEAVVDLRELLRARTVAVVGEDGRIIVQAGDAPGEVLRSGWELPLMAAMSAADTFQAYLPGTPQNRLQVFSADDSHAILLPMGQYGLLVIIPAKNKPAVSEKILQQIIEMQERVAPFVPPFDVVSEGEFMSEDVPEVDSGESSEEPVPQIDLSELFSAPIEEGTAESFWEEVEEEEQETPESSGKTGYLGYSQAEKLGLTPEDIEEDAAA